MTYTVREDVAIGHTIAIFTATDPDSLQVEFGIQSASTEFAIDQLTGEFTLISPLDYETVTAYQLVIMVTEVRNDSLTPQIDSLPVTISVQDINENPPELLLLSQNQATVDSSPGTIVATFQCTDGTPSTPISYGLTDTSNQFSIDSGTGVVFTLSVNAQGVSTPNTSYPITVICKNQLNLTASIDVMLEINNEDTVSPEFVRSRSITTHWLVREDASNGTVVGSYSATDPDSPDWQFSLLGTTALAIDADTGEITVTEPLDFEIVTFYLTTVVVTETRVVPGPPQSESISVIVLVINVNEYPPVFTQMDVFPVGEQSSLGTVAGQFRCVDGDPNRSAQMRYHLNDPSGQFTISIVTGVITTLLLTPLPLTTLQLNYTVTVTCTEQDSPPFTNMTTAVLFVDKEDNIQPMFVTTMVTEFGIREDIAVNSTVTILTAMDPDSIGILYSLASSGNIGNAFRIDQDTGVLQINAELDFESVSSYALIAIATEVGIVAGAPQTDTIVVTINVQDINEQAPLFTQINQTRVMEEATPGTLIGLVHCIDTDPNLNAPMIYSLNDPSGQFQIDDIIGVISIINTGLTPVDVNTYIATYSVTAICTEDQDPFLTANVTIDFEIEHIDSIPPSINTTIVIYSISESSSIGNIIAVITATDPDSPDIQFTLEENATVPFTIEPQNGTLSVHEALDFENITTYQLTVVATEVRIVPGNAQNDFVILTVNIVDANDEPPMFITVDTTPVDEDVQKGSVVALIQCMDRDALNTPISYSIDDLSGQFAISNSSGTVTTVSLNPINVTLLMESFNVTVFCTETLTPFTTVNVGISVVINKVDTTPPVITTSQIIYSIHENAIPSDTVAFIEAVDPDSAGIQFSLIGTAAAAFSIHPHTGAIQVVAFLDYETTESYQATVMVTEVRIVPGTPLSDSITITINIIDINDNLPIFTQTDTMATLVSAPQGTVLASVECMDGDAGIGSPIFYSLIDLSGQFSINSSLGEIVSESLTVLDVNTVAVTYSVTAICTESNPPSFSTNTTLSITINNQDTISPTITTTNTVFNVSEDIMVGSDIATITATDPDSPGVRFDLEGVSLFSIDRVTGVIEVGAPLDFEIISSYQLTVIVTETRLLPGLTQSNSINITINVEDVNELPPEFVQIQVLRSSEESPPGTVVATVECRDGDQGINAPVVLSLIDPSNQFVINNSSGNVIIGFLLSVDINVFIAEYPVTIICMELEMPSFSINTTFNIEISKEDTIPPNVTTIQTDYLVSEDASIGYIVAVITATDPDSSGIQFSLQGAGVFMINQTSGIIQVGARLDFETTSSYTVTVTATEVRVVPGLPQTDVIDVTINLVNVNELPPEFTQIEVIRTGEESLSGTVVATVECRDGDLNINASVVLSLIDSSDQFTINNVTGDITAVSLLPVNVSVFIQEYPVTVVCTEIETPSYTSSMTVLLQINGEDNIAPNITTTQLVYFVSENASIGDTVALITATDPDSSGLQFSIQDTGTFTIGATSGVLSVAAPLDFETVIAYSFTVAVTEIRVIPGVPQTDSITITVNLENVNELPPEFVRIEVIRTGEESPPGTVVATVKCRDGDLNINASVVLSLIDPSNQFTINNMTGDINSVFLLPVNVSIFIQVYQVIVTCTEIETPSFTTSTQLTLEINGEDSIPPNITTTQAVYTIRENASLGDLVAIITVEDPDSSGLLFNIQGTGAFGIGTTSGMINVRAPLDFETISSYSFIVTVTEVRVIPGVPQTDSINVTINLENLNELPPEFTQIEVIRTGEESLPGTLVATVKCRDGDLNINASVVLSLIDPSNQFTINNMTGDITTVSLLPVNVSIFIQVYQVIVTCTEIETPSFTTSTQLTLEINGEDSIPPNITTTQAVYTIRENASLGDLVAIITVEDPDSSGLLFNIQGTGAFGIGTTSGMINVRAPLDFETISSYSFIVTVTEVRVIPGVPQTDSINVTINLENLNELPPEFTQIEVIRTGEESLPGTLVATVKCRDRDLNINASVVLSLIDPSNQFTINNMTGDITTVSLLPVNVSIFIQVYQVIVTCTEIETPSFTTSTQLTLEINGEDSIPPNITTTQAVYTIRENASLGDLVAIITVEDPDSSGLLFNIQGTEAFGIGTTSGMINVRAPLDFETISSYSFIVTVTEVRVIPGVPQTDSINVTINLENLNELPPEFTQIEVIRTGEESLPGTLVATVKCRDGDLNINASVVLSLIDPSNQFTINNMTGDITTVSLLPVNIDTYIQEYSITVYCTEKQQSSTFSSSMVVLLEIAKEDNVPPNITTTMTTYTVNEDASLRDTVAIITASDPDSSGVLFSLQGSDDFTVDTTSGTIQVGAALDFETVSSYQVIVTATEMRVVPGPAQNDTLVLTINIGNVNEYPPLFTAISLNTISVHSPPETVIGSVGCRDGDTNINTTVRFNYSDPSGQFSINNNTGIVITIFLAPLNVSTYIQTYSIPVTCTENQPPYFSVDTVISVDIANEDIVPPTITTTLTNYSVREDAAITEQVANFSAIDPDSPQIRFTVEDTSSVFAIGPDSGTLYVAAPLDYETTTSYTIVVIASEIRVVPGIPQTASLQVIINIENVNEFPPLFEEINQMLLSESALPGSLITAIRCVDGDTNINAPIEYNISDPTNQFAINSNTGDIVAVSLNPLSENVAFFTSFIVSVYCTEREEPFFNTSLSVSLIVTRDDTFPPSITDTQTIYTVSEAAFVDTVVASFTATDPDSAGIDFILQGTGASDFVLEVDSGILRVGSPLDRENISTYQLLVIASESTLFAGAKRSDSLEITINILDVNDNSPTCSATNPETNLSPGTYKIARVLSINCTDSDAGQNAELSYILLRTVPSVPGGDFIIVGSDIIFDGTIEKDNKYTLSIQVGDQGAPRLSTTLNVTINVETQISPVRISSGGIAAVVVVIVILIIAMIILAVLAGLYLLLYRQRRQKKQIR